jgi:hypothetical protein
MKALKIGEDIHYKSPLSGQVLVGMVVSFDEETAVVWRDTRPWPRKSCPSGI